MIQVGTLLNVIDNSGARKVACIKVLGGYKKRYALLGDIIVISIKSLRTKRKSTAKVKKGEVCYALVVRTNKGYSTFSNESLKFFENSVILLNKQNKYLGTRIFGSLPNSFRYTKYLRLLSLSSGVIY
jgi:large subunit ribosomal protein L14